MGWRDIDEKVFWGGEDVFILLAKNLERSKHVYDALYKEKMHTLSDEGNYDNQQ